MSVRNRGRSISFVMEKLMGYTGRQLFLIFCFACLILVVAIFTLMIAGMFVQIPAVASASLMFIVLAPLFAFVTIRLGVSLKFATYIFVPLVFLTVYLGNIYQLNLLEIFNIEAKEATYLWVGVLAIYIFLASIVPVQYLLQPRDYLNSFLLYGMLALGFFSIIFYNPEIKLNSFNG